MPGASFYHSPEWRKLRRACLERDNYTCVVAGCGVRTGLVADHIKSRPYSVGLTAFDRLDNLRTLCRAHDNQVKEARRGSAARNSGGRLTVIGCDESGRPRDPAHPWNARTR